MTKLQNQLLVLKDTEAYLWRLGETQHTWRQFIRHMDEYKQMEGTESLTVYFEW